MNADYAMKPVELPAMSTKGRPLKDAVMVAQRREQLLASPNQWFLWEEASPRFQEMTKVLVRLMGLPASTPVRRKEWAIKGATRKNDDGTWALYVAYVPQDLSIKRS